MPVHAIKSLFTILMVCVVWTLPIHSINLEQELEQAVDTHQPERVIDLLKQGLSPNSVVRDEKGGENYVPLLVWSVHAGYLNLVKFLLEESSSQFQDMSKIAELMPYAAISGNLELVKYLVGKGVEPNFKEPGFENTALIYALSVGHVEMVKYLVEKCDALKGDHGRHVLIMAIQKGDLEIVKYLVGKGAELKAGNRAGKTVLDIAQRSRNQEIVSFFKNAH